MFFRTKYIITFVVEDQKTKQNTFHNSYLEVGGPINSDDRFTIVVDHLRREGMKKAILNEGDGVVILNMMRL